MELKKNITCLVEELFLNLKFSIKSTNKFSESPSIVKFAEKWVHKIINQ